MAEKQLISLTGIVGSGLCVASEDGAKVYEAISDALAAGRDVVISFEGVEDLTSAFVNAAIGRLYDGRISADELRARLTVQDASPEDLATLKRSVDRAKEYFRDPERFRTATDEVLGDDD